MEENLVWLRVKTVECLCLGTVGILTSIFALEASLLGKIFVLRTSNFRGATIDLFFKYLARILYVSKLLDILHSIGNWKITIFLRRKKNHFGIISSFDLMLALKKTGLFMFLDVPRHMENRSKPRTGSSSCVQIYRSWSE